MNTDNNMVMPVAPMNNGFGNGGFGYGGDGLFWIIILFLFMFSGFGNWGNGFGGNNNGTTYVANDVQRGFDQSAVMTGLNNINTNVSNGFANAEISRCNAQANLTNQLNNIGMSLQNCCCENRQSTADLKYSLAVEACADRAAVNDGVRDILQATNDGVQKILTQMCDDKIDAKNEQIANLQQQLALVNLANSQNVQTAEIINTLRMPTPIPAFPVNPPYQYSNASGCVGCGCSV